MEQLDTGVLSEIMQFVNPADVPPLRTICSHWNQVITHDMNLFWKNKLVHSLKNPPKPKFDELGDSLSRHQEVSKEDQPFMHDSTFFSQPDKCYLLYLLTVQRLQIETRNIVNNVYYTDRIYGDVSVPQFTSERVQRMSQLLQNCVYLQGAGEDFLELGCYEEIICRISFVVMHVGGWMRHVRIFMDYFSCELDPSAITLKLTGFDVCEGSEGLELLLENEIFTYEMCDSNAWMEIMKYLGFDEEFLKDYDCVDEFAYRMYMTTHLRTICQLDIPHMFIKT